MPVTGLSGPFRVTNFYEQNDGLEGSGWSETQWFTGTSYTLIAAALLNFIPKRLLMMNPDCFWVASRIAYPGQKWQDVIVDASTLSLSTYIGGYVPTSGGSSTQTCPSDTALLWRVTDINGFHSSFFLHGVPQAIVQGNNYLPDPAFTTAIGNYYSQMFDHCVLKEPAGAYGSIASDDGVRVRSRKCGRAFGG
jgi:hypothetical protein